VLADTIAVDELPLEIVPVSRADAFAVVAARDHGGVVMTGDPEFRPLAEAGVVAVEWLPRRRA